MSKARAIISLPAGRRARWIVLAGWLIVIAVAGPLAGKLGSAEQNDAKSWLPASAESTRVLDLQSRVQSPNVYPAVVVYDRPSGITATDRGRRRLTSTALPAYPACSARRSPDRSSARTGRRFRPSSRWT
jgi:RND superfamily putative drug exporter